MVCRLDMAFNLKMVFKFFKEFLKRKKGNWKNKQHNQQSLKHLLSGPLQKSLLTPVFLLFSHQVLSDSATPWTVAHIPLSIGFSRQEYWRGWPCPPPGDLPYSGIEPAPATLAGKFLSRQGSSTLV